MAFRPLLFRSLASATLRVKLPASVRKMILIRLGIGHLSLPALLS